MQMVSVYFDNDTALLNTILLVCHLLLVVRLGIVVFSQEHETLAITSRRDKHHVHHILSIKLLMMSDLPHKVVVQVVLPLVVIVLYKVIN